MPKKFDIDEKWKIHIYTQQNLKIKNFQIDLSLLKMQIYVYWKEMYKTKN
jgi:hypothetical protein